MTDYSDYDTDELVELYVSLEQTIQDPVRADLTAMQQQKAVGEELRERGVSDDTIREEMEAQDFSSPLP